MVNIRDEAIAQYLAQKQTLDNLVKSRGLDDLYIFNKYILNVEQGKQKLAPFHKELCQFVMDDKGKKKLMLLPRGHLKSTLVTIGYATQQITKNPNKRVLILSATWQMAVDFLTEIKRHLQGNEKLIELYGDIARNPDEWSQDRITLKRTDTNIKGPTAWATGIESNLVGSHPDIIILDDVVSRDNTGTREQIEKIKLRYKDLLDLLEPGGEFLVIGTRWVVEDLYGWIMDRESNISTSYRILKKEAYSGNLSMNEVDSFLWPEKFTVNLLKDLLREKGSYEFCTRGDTPILMSDFTEKPISQIKSGDEIIGFEPSGKSGRMKLCKTIVKNTYRYENKPIYKLRMENGRSVFCTEEHKWYTARQDESHKLYAPAKKGKNLMFVCPNQEPISQSDKENWRYLAGAFDADGTTKSGGCLSITQGHIKNEVVYKKIIQTLKDLNIEYGEYERKVTKDKWNDNKIIWMKDNFNVSLGLIRYGQCAKSEQISSKIIENGKRFIKRRDKIKAMTKAGFADVYALETGTGNYIAAGYASSNSAQYLNDPIPAEDATFKRTDFRYFNLEDNRGKQMKKILTIDPAISTSKDADMTAMVGTGIDTFTNIFILALTRAHFTPQEIIDEIFRLQELWHFDTIGIETIAFQKALAYSLNEQMRVRKRFLPIVEIKSHDKSKDQRIKGLQPLYQQNKIYHQKELENNIYLEDELISFPRGRRDDVVDALSMQLDFWIPPRRGKRRYQDSYLY